MTHQEIYAPAFAADPRCRLVAVADESDVPPKRASLNQLLAQDLGLPYIRDLDSALSRDDVHIVSVCPEPERRGRVTVRCACAGKHVYIDKPMAASVSDAAAVVAAVREAGVRSHVFSLITTTWARRAKRILDSGELGDLLAVHADVLFAKGPAGTATLGAPRQEHFPPRRFTFSDSKRELYEMGVYAAGLARWLSGREACTVYGATANYFFQEHQQNDVEDFGLLMLSLEGGVSASITGGRIGWMSYPHDSLWGVRLIGTQGIAVVDPHHPRLEVYADEPAWTPPRRSSDDPMGFWRSTQQEAGIRTKKVWIPLQKGADPQGDVSYFLDCIQRNEESQMSAVDGAAVVEMLMAGYLSAATQRVVSLPIPRTG
jgi:predicted dehydrogenase